MKYFKLAPLIYISIFCLISLVTAIQPGKPDSLFAENILFSYFCSLLLSAAVAVSFILLLIAGLIFVLPKTKISQRFHHPIRTSIKPNLLALTISLVTGFLLYSQAPAKAGFALSYPEFQKAVIRSSDTKFVNGEGKNIGLYKLEAVSPNLKNSGGVHFLTFTYYDTVTANYGFAYKPFGAKLEEKKPFGAIEYVHIFGDWYIFHGVTC